MTHDPAYVQYTIWRNDPRMFFAVVLSIVKVLSCLVVVLSCLMVVLSCLVLSCLVMSSHGLSCGCLVLSDLVLGLSCLVVFCLVLSALVLFYLVVVFLSYGCLVLPLSCLAIDHVIVLSCH